MFGYVIADREIMTEEQVGRYRAYYCGLCRALKRRHGAAARFTLNYDMTFLVLLLSSMCEPEEEESGCGRCAAQCPAGAIDPDDPRQVDAGLCFGCLRCVSRCPQQARVLPAEQYAAVCQMLQKVCAGHRENELFLPAEG